MAEYRIEYLREGTSTVRHIDLPFLVQFLDLEVILASIVFRRELVERVAGREHEEPI